MKLLYFVREKYRLSIAKEYVNFLNQFTFLCFVVAKDIKYQ